MLTGAAARTGLLVTAGHPDILVIREGGRTAPFDLAAEYPEPLVPRSLTFEFAERTLADGSVLRPLDDESALVAVDELATRDRRAAGDAAVDQ